MLLPEEIAKQLSPSEVMTLDEIVIRTWNQKFGVVKVTRSKHVTVEIELNDRTHHEVTLS